jgi:hypothetical protein
MAMSVPDLAVLDAGCLSGFFSAEAAQGWGWLADEVWSQAVVHSVRPRGTLSCELVLDDRSGVWYRWVLEVEA